VSRYDRVGIAPQAAIETPASSIAFSPPLEAESGGLNRSTLDINEMLGSRAPTTSEYGLRSIATTLSGAPRPVSFGLLLSSFLGAPATAGTGPYTHAYDPLAVDYPVPLTIWGVNKDRMRDSAGAVLAPIVVKWIGAVGNQMTVSCEVDNYLRFEGSYVALDHGGDSVAEPSMTSDTGKKWVFSQVGVQIAVADGSLATTYASSFSWVYNNNLIDDQGRLGSNMLDDIPLGNEIESTLTVNFRRDIPDHFWRAFKDTPEKVRLGLVATGAGGNNFSLGFPYLETVSAPVTRSGGDTLRGVEVTFNVVADPATGKMVTPVLTNTNAGALYAA
jgi:hypothetical protein